jgi:hypothetical protein
MTQFRILQRQVYQEPCAAGQVVFRKGDPGDKMYVIVPVDEDRFLFLVQHTPYLAWS